MNEVRYRVRHTTEYRYSENVAVCQNQIRMQPISRDEVTCHGTKVEITPEPTSIDEHSDYFGNLVQTFSIEGTHRSLSVTVESDVTIEPERIATTPDPSWEACLRTVPGYRAHRGVDEFRFDSPRIARSEGFAGYARESFPPGRPVLEAALDLTTRIHHDFRYDSKATHVDTTPEEVFRDRAGVCQDFAHVELACLRSIGLAARYVSGYLRTDPPPGKPRLIGADESHAWVEIFVPNESGWVGLDPTNACIVGTDHIPICVGRDYGDVSPMRGVVLGGGTTTLKVAVDVAPQGEELSGPNPSDQTDLSDPDPTNQSDPTDL